MLILGHSVLVLLQVGPGLLEARKTDTGPGEKGSGQTPGARVLKMILDHKGPAISAGHPDVLAINKRSGFETGLVVKLNNVINGLGS